MEAAKLDIIPFDNTRLELRPVTAGDREFLLQVYASGREIELSMLPWDEQQKKNFVEHQFTAQTAYYLEKFPDATHDVILFDGESAGRLYVHRDDQLISILDLAVLPGFRKQGIGTSVITSLRDEAANSGRRVGVYVENFNPSKGLFTKLGFSVVSSDEMNLYLEWSGSAG